jgi:hypothetical protein
MCQSVYRAPSSGVDQSEIMIEIECQFPNPRRSLVCAESRPTVHRAASYAATS